MQLCADIAICFERLSHISYMLARNACNQPKLTPLPALKLNIFSKVEHHKTFNVNLIFVFKYH